MDVDREFPRKVNVKDLNGIVFKQIVHYEWVQEYCDKFMPVRHKSNAREGIKPLAQAKKVLKSKHNVDGNKARELEIQGSKEDMKVPT